MLITTQPAVKFAGFSRDPQDSMTIQTSTAGYSDTARGIGKTDHHGDPEIRQRS